MMSISSTMNRLSVYSQFPITGKCISAICFWIFPEIFKRASECRFYNCTHIHEPGCAVLEAVEKGEISESRYFSYVSMFEEGDEKYRK